MRMVARGAGLAIVPLAAIQRRALDQPLKSFTLNEDWAQRKLLLCARSFTGLPGYARALLEALLTE
jgi:DNA-binding transcriptional LysR family regulator